MPVLKAFSLIEIGQCKWNITNESLETLFDNNECEIFSSRQTKLLLGESRKKTIWERTKFSLRLGCLGLFGKLCDQLGPG